MLSFTPETELEQEQLGASLAAICPAGSIVYLRGDLGTGKTTLVRGFLRGAGYVGKVKSPTYTLIEPYVIGDRTVYHLDLYRLGHPEELEYLGIRDMMQEAATLLIEWPEQGEGMLPEADLIVSISYAGAGRRVQLAADNTTGQDILRDLAATGSSVSVQDRFQ